MPQVRSMLQVTGMRISAAVAFFVACVCFRQESWNPNVASASASHKIKHLGFFFPSLPDGLGCRTALSRLLVSECGQIGIDLT